VVAFDTVRSLALALPEVVETTSYGTPSFKLRRRMIARLRETGVLVVRIDLADKEFLIQSQPETYFTTPHYDGYPAVLVRLPEIDREELGGLLAAAWRFVAPPKLAAALTPAGREAAARAQEKRVSRRNSGEDRDTTG
jgi:hypothetical protein